MAITSGAAEEGLDALSASVSAQAEAARGRLARVYIVSLITSAATLIISVFLVWAALRIIRKHVIAPIRGAMGTLQDSSQRIGGVVEEVRKRTRTSSGSAQALSGLTEQLSAALEEIAGNTAAITASASGTQEDAVRMAEDCASITAYSVPMRSTLRLFSMARSRTAMISSVRVRTSSISAWAERSISSARSRIATE